MTPKGVYHSRTYFTSYLRQRLWAADGWMRIERVRSIW
jgi:hypothetical protein